MRPRDEVDPDSLDLGGPGLVAALARSFRVPSAPEWPAATELAPDEAGPFVEIRYFKGPTDGEIPDLMAFVRGQSRENVRSELRQATVNGYGREWHRYRVGVVDGEIRSASIK